MQKKTEMHSSEKFEASLSLSEPISACYNPLETTGDVPTQSRHYVHWSTGCDMVPPPPMASGLPFLSQVSSIGDHCPEGMIWSHIHCLGGLKTRCFLG